MRQHRVVRGMTRNGALAMANRSIPGDPLASDLFTCRARAEDFGNVPFWTSSGEPIAPTGRVADAVVAILGHLGERS